MDRKEKIKLLKDIRIGKLSPADLHARRLQMLIGYGDATQYFIDGKAVSEDRYLEEESKADLTNLVIGYGPEE